MTTSKGIVVAWPPLFVLIQKVAPVSVPASPSGDPRTYRYGARNPDVSLPVDYSIVGWLMSTPVVGEVVRVLRVTRNSTIMPGIFVTTEVVEVPRHGEFLTANSIYHWSEIAQTPQFTSVNMPPKDFFGTRVGKEVW